MPVTVKTRQWSGGLVASQVSFKKNDAKLASMIHNGTDQRFGEQAAATEERIRRAIRLMNRIDEILAEPDENLRNELLIAIKGQVDSANISTVCDKRELEAQISGLWKINFVRGVQVVISEMWREFRAKQ